MRSFPPTWTKRAWAAHFRFIRLPVFSAARSLPQSSRRWLLLPAAGALILAGAVGPLVALLLIVIGIPEAGAADRQVEGIHPNKQSTITPTLMVLTAFFMLLALSNAGIANFGVVALMNGYGESFSSANIALTAYLGLSAIGVLAGG